MAFGLFATPTPGVALDTTPLSLKTDQYALTVANRQKQSDAKSDSIDEDPSVFEAQKDMFTQDAWLGMQRYDPMAFIPRLWSL